MASICKLWARRYRKAARTDRYRKLKERLEAEGSFDSTEAAKSIVEKTVHFVECLNRCTDRKFLALQTYDPFDSDARYIMNFQGGEFASVEVLCTELSNVDLAEMFGSGGGFSLVNISRNGRSSFRGGERRRLKRLVQSDFFYDYGRDEIELSFEEGPGHLTVEVAETR